MPGVRADHPFALPPPPGQVVNAPPATLVASIAAELLHSAGFQVQGRGGWHRQDDNWPNLRGSNCLVKNSLSADDFEVSLHKHLAFLLAPQ